jgi:hypothetical protein
MAIPSDIRLWLAAVAIGLAASSARAAEIYVTNTGAGLKDGSSWGNAFGTLQAAIDAAAAGDTIYLAAGHYVDETSVTDEPAMAVVEGLSSLTIRGGYAGSGTPGARGAGESIIRPTGISTKRRGLRVAGCAIELDGLVFQGGYATGASILGVGLSLSSVDTLNRLLPSSGGRR